MRAECHNSVTIFLGREDTSCCSPTTPLLSVRVCPRAPLVALVGFWPSFRYSRVPLHHVEIIGCNWKPPAVQNGLREGFAQGGLIYGNGRQTYFIIAPLTF